MKWRGEKVKTWRRWRSGEVDDWRYGGVERFSDVELWRHGVEEGGGGEVETRRGGSVHGPLTGRSQVRGEGKGKGRGGGTGKG